MGGSEGRTGFAECEDRVSTMDRRRTEEVDGCAIGGSQFWGTRKTLRVSVVEPTSRQTPASARTGKQVENEKPEGSMGYTRVIGGIAAGR